MDEAIQVIENNLSEQSFEKEDWYISLVDECKAIITEAVFTSRWALVEGYWNLGKRIREDENIKKFGKGNNSFLQLVGKNLNISVSTIYYALQAYDKYPDINNLPEGKNITWKKLIEKYLPQEKEEVKLPDGFVLPKDVEVINEDFRQVKMEENYVDLIITDPPYPSEFLPLWEDLAIFAERVLKPSGFLVAYSGQIHLLEVMNLLARNLNYYWTFSLYHTGQTQLVMPRNVICRWKPILIFQKPPFKKLENVYQDYVVSEQREKGEHEWQQSESGVTKLIECFSKPGDTVVDPFAGSGTFSKVAHSLQRKSIAIEIDKHYSDVSKSRFYDNTTGDKQL